MEPSWIKDKEAKPLGYAYLIKAFNIRVLPNFISCYFTRKSTETVISGGYIEKALKIAQYPEQDVYAHLKCALRYEDVCLPVLKKVLPQLDPVELAKRIQEEPTSAYARRLWFLYEELTNIKLALADVKQGNYVPLIDPEEFYTGKPRKSQRHRVDVNLLGDLHFCFTVRKTKSLKEATEKNWDVATHQLVKDVAPELFQRTLNYLYLKETKSSFQIERETPDKTKADLFMNLLQSAGSEDCLDKASLVRLQNTIVSPANKNAGWRDTKQPPEQNFVSGKGAENLAGIHYIPPRPEEIETLMQSWLRASRLAMESDVPPVIVAAAVAWSFVFLHPFSDGNGRIHRFLIHHVLSKRGFGQPGMIFPVSAAILNDPRSYDASLEAFSRPLMRLLDWQMDDENGELTVTNDSSDFYRWVDYTPMAEALYGFVEHTVKVDLPQELAYLKGYDAARDGMREIVDLSDPVAYRFIQFCRQNGWKLSKAKRNVGGLDQLTDEQVAALEAVLQAAFALPD